MKIHIRRWKVIVLLFVLGFFLTILILSNSIGGFYTPSQPSTSDSEDVTGSLAVLIVSSYKNTLRRKAIRETWLKLKPTDRRVVKHFFAVAVDDLSYEERRQLLLEHSASHDLLILTGSSDSYQSLTRKVKVGLKWLHENLSNDFTYILKVDDDSFVHLPQLFDYLTRLGHQERLYLGFFYGRGRPRRHGRWAEKSWFLCTHYLPHARGGGYLLSRDLVKFIVDSFSLLSEYANEDVSVGTWLAPLDIHRVHEPLFDVEYRSRGCHNRYLISHKLSVDEMRQRYENLRRLGNMCEVEKALHPSYRYNWSVDPLECCQRTWEVP